MTASDYLDDAIDSRLGPSPRALLEQQLARVDKTAAAVLIVQRADESLEVYSAGCTVLETLGMLAWAQPTIYNACDTDEGETDD